MAQDLLAALSERGIKLRLADGRLEVLAPAGALTPELRERLRHDRSELIELLRDAEAAGELPQLTPRPQARHEPFPLTDIQHAYWVGRTSAVELGGVSTHYYFELERAGLDPDRLAQSLRLVIARHDMLRAIIEADGRQRVLAHVPDFQIPVSDLRDLPPAQRSAELAAIRADLGHRAPQADTWPLLEVRVSLLPDDLVRLHLSVNLLVADAFSLALIFEDWRRYYVEPGISLGPLPLSYRDYVLANEQLRAGSRYRRAKDYWAERAGRLPPAPALPMARRPADLAVTEFTGRSARLGNERWVCLKRVAAERGLTPSAVLMTAFADVLRAWSGQRHFTLNLTLFDRPPLHPRLGDIVGDFTSLTMLEVDGDCAETFAGRAAALQRQLMRDLEHSAYSGVRVLRDRARQAGGSQGAAMPVVFTSALALSKNENPALGRQFFGEFRYSISQTPQIWLDHQVSEERGQLLLNWDSVEALFPSKMLDDMFGTYCTLLDQLACDSFTWDEPAQLLRLPAWQLAERNQANATRADLPAVTLCDLAEAQAARTPDAVAVIAGADQLSYAEVIADARRLARHLAGLGAAPGQLIAVVLGKDSEQVPAVLGICESGAAYLPVDPQWPAARRRQVLEQGGVRIAVTAPRYRDELTWPPGITLVTFADAEVRQAGSAALTRLPRPDDLAYVIFTSGSTGQPKGVAIDHRAAVNTVIDINRRFGVGPGDRVLALSSLTFDLSVWDIFGLLAAGGALVLPPAAGERDPRGWSALVARHGVTIWNSVPALMQAWLEDGGPASAEPARSAGAAGSAGQIRLVMLSGDLIPVPLPGQVRAAMPGAQVVSLGGATEASIWSLWHPIGELDPGCVRIPYGKPLANQSLHVYDENLREVPTWTPGELYIGGTGLARGYWNDAQQTAARFIAHPLTGQRLYRTGDLARYRLGGDLDFLGRMDFQVKLNGYRIELDEIAAALRGCDGVSDAIATVAVNPASGRRQLVGYVVPDGIGPGVGGAGTLLADRGQAGWLALVAAGAEQARSGAAEHASALAVFETWWQAWEGLGPKVMARTLARLGEFRAAGRAASAAEIVARHRIKARYTGLIRQWLAVLAQEKLLLPLPDEARYQCTAGFDADRIDAEISARLADEVDPLVEAGELAGVLGAFTRYLRECADCQVGLLRGQVSPLQLLLGDDAGAVTDALYASNPVSYLMNRIAAAVVQTFAGQRRPVRVLEVGAGTGATTAAILPLLRPGQVSYRFTDVSSFFTQRAAVVFADRAEVAYGIYDIDADPAAQGIAEGSFDVVVAANVLHDAKDLAATLRQLRRTLAPEGIIVAIEGTANSRIQLISVGFIEGFASHEGSRDLPLLNVPQWRAEFAAAGFTAFTALPDTGPLAQAMVQQVLVARAPGGDRVLDAGRLREALEGLLPGYLVPQHYLVIDKVPLTANGKADRSALPTPWASAAAPERVEPRDPTERTLLAMWQDVLGREDFGVQDNFFELGGDSLHALRIFQRLRDDFGWDETADEGIQALLRSPTVAGIAAMLREPRADRS
jgi:pyochelin synthetase